MHNLFLCKGKLTFIQDYFSRFIANTHCVKVQKYEQGKTGLQFFDL